MRAPILAIWRKLGQTLTPSTLRNVIIRCGCPGGRTAAGTSGLTYCADGEVAGATGFRDSRTCLPGAKTTRTEWTFPRGGADKTMNMSWKLLTLATVFALALIALSPGGASRPLPVHAGPYRFMPTLALVTRPDLLKSTSMRMGISVKRRTSRDSR